MPATIKTEQKLTRADQKQLSTRRLIEAAIAIASDSGVAAVTFETIAEKAGYSRGLAFQKFGSKDGLIQAVTDFLFEEIKQDPDMKLLASLNGLDALKSYASFQLQTIRKEAHSFAYFRFFASAIADKTTSQLTFRSLHEVFREMFAEFLNRGQRDGSIRPLDKPLVAAEIFGSMLLGCTLQAMANPELDIAAVELEVLTIAHERFAART